MRPYLALLATLALLLAAVQPAAAADPAFVGKLAVAVDPEVARELGLSDEVQTKLKEIDQIVASYPKRRFVLVGDSGQQDPELYGRIARKYPDQVARVYIRELDETTDETRYEKAFQDVPAGTWQVFRNPGELRLPQ